MSAQSGKRKSVSVATASSWRTSISPCVQFFVVVLAICSPMIFVLIWISADFANQRVARVESNSQERALDLALDKKLQDIDAELDLRLREIDERLDAKLQIVDALLSEHMTAVDARLLTKPDAIGARIGAIDARLEARLIANDERYSARIDANQARYCARRAANNAQYAARMRALGWDAKRTVDESCAAYTQSSDSETLVGRESDLWAELLRTVRQLGIPL